MPRNLALVARDVAVRQNFMRLSTIRRKVDFFQVNLIWHVQSPSTTSLTDLTTGQARNNNHLQNKDAVICPELSVAPHHRRNVAIFCGKLRDIDLVARKKYGSQKKRFFMLALTRSGIVALKSAITAISGPCVSMLPPARMALRTQRLSGP